MTLDLTRYMQPGDTVLIGQGTAEPRALVEALIAQRSQVGPVRVVIGASFSGLFQPEHTDFLRFTSIGAIGDGVRLAKSGALNILPIHIASLNRMIASGRLEVDVALAQVSESDSQGRHSLGLVADYLPAAIESARSTLGEINAQVPFTLGDTLVPSEHLSATIRDDRALLTIDSRDPLPSDQAIAAHVSPLIPDGATLQVGIGRTPDEVLRGLASKKDLGVHSGLIGDSILDLIQAGAITNRAKEIDAGRTVTGALFGTTRLYSWADRNGSLAMKPISYTHSEAVLSQFECLFAINSAIEVDLTGQINAESAGGRHVGLVGGQVSFARAATQSRHGRSVTVLPATARGGQVSRIVAKLDRGIVTTPRADVDLVVTEYGVADLRDATLTERKDRLVRIAHPAFRDSLLRH